MRVTTLNLAEISDRWASRIVGDCSTSKAVVRLSRSSGLAVADNLFRVEPFRFCYFDYRCRTQELLAEPKSNLVRVIVIAIKIALSRKLNS